MSEGILRWFLVVFFLAVMLPGSTPAETVIVRAHGGQYRVESVLNGQYRVRALVDTGATAVLFCARLGRELKLRLGKVETIATANGKMEAHRALLRSLRLGGIELRAVSVLVVKEGGDCSEILVGTRVLQRLRLLLVAGDIMVLIGP